MEPHHTGTPRKGLRGLRLTAKRLILRLWEGRDREPFALMNADPKVMEYFPDMLSQAESDSLIDRCVTKWDRDGFGLLPVEVKATGDFAGMVGLNRPQYDRPLPFEPCVEIGWRFGTSAWGHGYATEAAREWLRFGFETLELEEIVSFTAKLNIRSSRVMERLGMSRNEADDFDHPMIADSHPLKPHMLYRLSREQWERTASSS